MFGLTTKQEKRSFFNMKIEEIIEILDKTSEQLKTTLKQKSSDYTGGEKSTDPFANFRATECLGVDPVIGIMMRIIDKIQRIRSFVNDGQLKVPNESVYDAFDDIIGYTILAKAMIMEKRQSKK